MTLTTERRSSRNVTPVRDLTEVAVQIGVDMAVRIVEIHIGSAWRSMHFARARRRATAHPTLADLFVQDADRHAFHLRGLLRLRRAITTKEPTR